MTKTEAKTATATDPATENVAATAEFPAEVGPSDGGAEMPDGEDAGGEGGEVPTSEGDGAVAGGVVTDGVGAAAGGVVTEGVGAAAGGVVTDGVGAADVDGDGDGETLRGGCAGDSDGDGDWAVVEATSSAAIKASAIKLTRAILDREREI
ncbi:hypothetical protein TIFTF001_028044 [Ficus carica]|uniref:Uncharacterized protein n=1 Tax=Ficus carica TaxID=3494 RepID=A0AA88DQA5_FICCA|nr:hypothetical protein TIFTF001_028044 [Ficus carica]